MDSHGASVIRCHLSRTAFIARAGKSMNLMPPRTMKRFALCLATPGRGQSGARSVESTISLRNILVATDFSRQSALALTYALPINRKYGSKVYATHVIPEQIGLPASAREGLQAIGVQRGSDAQDAVASLTTQLCSIPHEILSRKGRCLDGTVQDRGDEQD
jgi:Universal stress protein family